MTPIQLAELAHQLADRACICDIECDAWQTDDEMGGPHWYDTRPMLDPRETCDDSIEMARQALQYAHERGLISPHPIHSHLVRITRRPA